MRVAQVHMGGSLKKWVEARRADAEQWPPSVRRIQRLSPVFLELSLLLSSVNSGMPTTTSRRT